MKIRVLFFAALRERMQQNEALVVAQDDESAAALAARLTGVGGCLAFAVNDELVSGDHLLRDGDTLALIPPMAGG
jgi:molybdopterin converting factor subunit 1